MAHNNDDLFKQANKYSKQRKSLYFVVEKLIRVRHLKQYVYTTSKQRKTVPKVAVPKPLHLR